MTFEPNPVSRLVSFVWQSKKKTRNIQQRHGSFENLERRSLMAADLNLFAATELKNLSETQHVGTLIAGTAQPQVMMFTAADLRQSPVQTALTPATGNAANNLQAAAAQSQGIATSSEIYKQIQAQWQNSPHDAQGNASLGNIKIGTFALTNAVAKSTADGMEISADLKLPVIGNVRVGGVLASDGTFTANLPKATVFNGLAAVENGKLTIAQNQLKLEADFNVPKLGINTKLSGSFQADGNYKLEASASFKIAGFKVDAGKFTLKDKLEVNFSLPMLGSKATFSGAYGANGWSVEGRIPVRVQVGPVTLTEVVIGVGQEGSKEFLKLGAKGTVLNLTGVVDGKVTAKVFSDGRINLEVTASSVKIGGFNAGNVKVTLTNDTPAGRSLYVTTFRGEIAPSGLGGKIHLEGEIHSNGHYRLQGQANYTLGGIRIADAKVELIKGQPLKISGSIDALGLNVKIKGTIASSGRFTFEGTGSAKIGGFKVGGVTVSGDFNPAKDSFKLHVEGKADLKIANVRVSADLARRGGKWGSFNFTGEAAINAGDLKGTASFTLSNNGASLSGKLTYKPLGVKVSAKATIKTNGKIDWNYKVPTMNDVSKAIAHAGGQVSVPNIKKALGF